MRSKVTLLAVAALVAGACSTGGGLLGGGGATGGDDGAAAATTTSGGAGALGIYLDTMQQLIEGDPLTAAEVFNDAERDAEIIETTTNKIRYALALSVPGHAGSDPAAAAERLRALLPITDLLPEERMLITIQLRQAEQLQRLATVNADLTRRIETATAASDAASAERLRSALAENDRLRRELEEANAMLDAITNIERRINDSEVQ
jgi:hypothetical protein